MSLGPSPTSDIIPFDQIWHHLHSTSAGGKHLSNDAQIDQSDWPNGTRDMHKNVQKVE